MELFIFSPADLDKPPTVVNTITLTHVNSAAFHFFCLACYHVIHLLCGSHKFDSVFLVFFRLLSPLSSDSHAASFPSAPPLCCLPFISPLLPSLLVMRSIISQSFYTREATAWLLADVDKGWCCGCQAIQIISGIKRSIAFFSKSSPFPDHRSSRVYFSLAE